MKIQPARSFRGVFRLPGDKSITHRAYLMGALAEGVTRVEGASEGHDCQSTRRCLQALGVRFETAPGEGPSVQRVDGGGAPWSSAEPLDCGNSGTTLRLLMGVLADRPGTHVLAGDTSLNGRPMERVARPLRAMGAHIETQSGRPPVTITGAPLRGAELTPEAASAQIKSALLLAALRAEGTTVIHEPLATRDHTERMLRTFGVTLRTEGTTIRIDGPQTLRATDIRIPGDPSSAAPFLVAGLILRDSEVVIEDLLLNPHRIHYIDVLRRMGADIETTVTSASGSEACGRVVARSSSLRGLTLEAHEVPAVVDELPILAVAAAFAEGDFEVHGAEELRVKESDRIACLVEGLRALGGSIEEHIDGFTVRGGRPLRGATTSSHGDHRIAMSLAIAALGAASPTEILGAEAVAISLPAFFPELERGAGR